MDELRNRAGICLVALALAGCSATASEAEDPTTTGEAPEATTEASPDATSEGGPTTTAAPNSTTTTETTIGVVAPTIDLQSIETSTPASGEGPRPELRWEPVPDAELYLVTVFDPSGAPYWAWQGETTSVHVGGEPQLRPEAAGPSVIDGMSWEVIAVDGELGLLAESERQELSP